MTETAEYIVSCDAKSKVSRKNHKYLELVYRAQQKRNVKLCFDDPFPFDILDDRIKDLLEIAAYLFSADIKVSQIENDEGCTSSKLFNFYLEVRDVTFWKQSEVKDILNNLLSFLTGNDYRFNFSRLVHHKISYHKRKSLPKEKRLVTFLSGGIDSAVGVIDLLEKNKESQVCMVSHQSNLPGVSSTQNNLYKIISDLYPERCIHIKFRSGLLNNHSFDKNYHTRALLYNAVAFAMASLYSSDHYYVYENGISAINFKGVNSIDDSTGRSVHPQTLHLLEELFACITGTQFTIKQPFLFKTKAEVIGKLIQYRRKELIAHTISCDRHHPIPLGLSHCGICPSCITRNIALFAKDYWREQKDLFYYDLLAENNLPPQAKEMIGTMLKEMIFFINQRSSAFCQIWEDEIIAVETNFRSYNFYSSVADRIYDLCCRHFSELQESINRMWNTYAAPWSLYKGGAFFSLLSESRGYMLELQSRELSELGVGYRQINVQPRTNVLRHIPPRQLKKKIIEKCCDLIDINEISDVTNEKDLGDKVIQELSKENLLTSANKRSISDYFRKGLLQIQDKQGKLAVIDNFMSPN